MSSISFLNWPLHACSDSFCFPVLIDHSFTLFADRVTYDEPGSLLVLKKKEKSREHTA